MGAEGSTEREVGRMGFKFVHAADIHLDSPLRGLERYDDAPVEEMRSATRRAFENLISLCIDEGAAFLLLAGDLYDGAWRDYNTVLFLIRQLNRLREHDVHVYVVHGNHDAENVMSKGLDMPGHVTVFGSKKPEQYSHPSVPVVVHGQSYPRTEVIEDLSAAFPQGGRDLFNVGLLHTSADGRSSEHKPYAPCSLQALIDKGYQYWALGHVHRRTELCLDPPILFPGNLQGRHIREAGPKGATLVHVDDDLRARPEHRDLDVVRWHHCEVTVSAADTPDAAIDRAVERLAALRRADPERPLAVRVRLTGQCDAHQKLVEREEHWANELRGRASSIEALWVEKVQLDTRTPVDLVALRKQPGALATLLRCLDDCRGDEAGLRSLAAGLSPLRKVLGRLDDAPLFEEPEELRALLGEVEQLVVPMLLDGGRRR